MDRRCSVVDRERRRPVVELDWDRRMAMGRAFVVDRMERIAASSTAERCLPVEQQLTAFEWEEECRRIGSWALVLACIAAFVTSLPLELEWQREIEVATTSLDSSDRPPCRRDSCSDCRISRIWPFSPLGD